MEKINELVICRENYKTAEEFEESIKKAIMLLLDNEYIMTVRYDEKNLGIVIINYDSAEPAFGAPYPYWLTSEEAEQLK